MSTHLDIEAIRDRARGFRSLADRDQQWTPDANVRILCTDIDDLIAALEAASEGGRARLAAVAALADNWRCNCGGPSPEGHHEMHCDSYYGLQLRAALADRASSIARTEGDPA